MKLNSNWMKMLRRLVYPITSFWDMPLLQCNFIVICNSMKHAIVKSSYRVSSRISNPLNQFQIEIRHFARLDRYFNQYHMFHYFNLSFHYFSFILFTVCYDCHICIGTILDFLLKYTVYSSNYGGYLKLLKVGKSPYVRL